MVVARYETGWAKSGEKGNPSSVISVNAFVTLITVFLNDITSTDITLEFHSRTICALTRNKFEVLLVMTMKILFPTLARHKLRNKYMIEKLSYIMQQSKYYTNFAQI